MRKNLNEDYLLIALQENLEHARHQENLRERLTFMYWAAWSASIGFIYQKGGDLLSYPWIFLLLFVISIPVLISTLKWSSEFANHMNAAASICNELGINIPNIKDRKFFTYPEFSGYMALPIKVPIYLNIAVILSIMECLGLALSVSLFLFGFHKSNITKGWMKCFFNEALWIILIGFLSFSVAIGICTWMYFYMKKRINKRTPKLRETKQGKEKTEN